MVGGNVQDQAVVYDLGFLAIEFSEDLDTVSDCGQRRELVDFGGDGVPGGGDDLVVGLASVSGAGRTVTIVPTAPLHSARYRLTLDPSIIADFAGNSPVAPILLEFTHVAAVPGTVSWIGRDGDWDESANWSGGRVPGPRDDVLIDVAGLNVTVTIQSGTRIVRSITSEESLRILGGSLQVSGASQLNGTLAMSPGTSLTASGAGATFVGSGSASADGASLYALRGGRIELPGLTQYAHAATVNDQTYTLRAEGAGVGVGPVGRDADHGRHALEFGLGDRSVRGGPDRPERRDAGSPTARQAIAGMGRCPSPPMVREASCGWMP